MHSKVVAGLGMYNGEEVYGVGGHNRGMKGVGVHIEEVGV